MPGASASVRRLCTLVMEYLKERLKRIWPDAEEGLAASQNGALGVQYSDSQQQALQEAEETFKDW